MQRGVMEPPGAIIQDSPPLPSGTQTKPAATQPGDQWGFNVLK